MKVMTNILSDGLLAASLLLAFHSAHWFVAKKIGLPRMPVIVISPIFLLVGFLLHLPLSPFYLPSDGVWYQEWGFRLGERWSSGDSSVVPGALEDPLWPGKGFWPSIIALFYSVVGPVTMTLIVFNTIVLGGVTLAIQKASLLISGVRFRWGVVAGITSSLPFLIFGPSLLREAIFWLGLSLCALALSFLLHSKIIPASSSLIMGVLVVMAVRPDAGLIFSYAFVIVFIFFLFVFNRNRKNQAIAVGGILFISFLALSFPAAVKAVSPRLDTRTVEIIHDKLSNVAVTTGFGNQQVQDNPESDGASESSCAENLYILSLCSAVTNLPYVLFGPFIWEYGGESIWFIAGLATLHFIAITALALLYSLSRESSKWFAFGIFSIAAASILLFSATLTNYGILIRMRAGTEIILLPLALSAIPVILKSANAARSARKLSLASLRRLMGRIKRERHEGSHSDRGSKEDSGSTWQKIKP